MSEDIKEILDKLKDNIPIEEYRSEGTSDGLTHYEEDKDSWQYKLYNCITNLQEKVNQYENPDDMTLFYMWLDEKAKDKMKELQDNLYSTNQVVNELLDVHKENERLNNKYNKVLELLVDFDLPCEIDDFNTTAGLDYCSKYCHVDNEQYKKCWDKFIEWKLGSVVN